MEESLFLQSFLSLWNSRGLRMDANETAFISKQLTFIESKVYETKYPGFIARDLFPKVKMPDDGANTYEYQIFDITGDAQVIENYAGDLPSVSLAIGSGTTKVRPIGDSFSYSVEDVKAAGRGISLPEQYPVAARRVIEQKIDSLCAVGSSAYGITGILNNSSVNLVTPITGSWTASTTAAQILADITKLLNNLVTQTVDVFRGQRAKCILPQSKMHLLNQPRSDNSDTTILEMLQKSWPEVDFISWWRCNTAGSGSTTRIMAGYFSEETGGLVIPREFTMEPVQQRNLSFYTPCHAKCGGAFLRYPVAFNYMDGV